MADAAARLAALEEAISSGLLRFTIEGKTQEYRSLTDMLRVRDMLRHNPRPDGLPPDARGRNWRVAWKTGTSWGYHDAWSAGIAGSRC